MTLLAHRSRALRTAALVGCTAVLSGLVYRRVAHELFDLTAGLLFLAAACTVLLLLVEILLDLFTSPFDIRTNMRLFVVTSGLLLVGLEIFLRFGLGTYATYLESNDGGPYRSLRRDTAGSRIHAFTPHSDRRLTREYRYFRRVNSLGLCEREINTPKPADEHRILALGDSFTEGVGAPYEATWVRVMEKELARLVPDRTVTAINAGIAGSDPFFEYVLLSDRLLSLKPDLVIVALNNSDVDEVILRGGMERFRRDGSVEPLTTPTWEWLYGISYLTRHFVHDILHYNRFLIKQDSMSAREARAIVQLREAISALSKLGREWGFAAVVVVHPTVTEVTNGHYAKLAPLVHQLHGVKDLHFLDLLEHYRVHEIMTRANAAEFYWKQDRHHNPKGYAVMGKAIAQKIHEWQLLDTPTPPVLARIHQVGHRTRAIKPSDRRRNE